MTTKNTSIAPVAEVLATDPTPESSPEPKVWPIDQRLRGRREAIRAAKSPAPPVPTQSEIEARDERALALQIVAPNLEPESFTLRVSAGLKGHELDAQILELGAVVVAAAKQSAETISASVRDLDNVRDADDAVDKGVMRGVETQVLATAGTIESGKKRIASLVPKLEAEIRTATTAPAEAVALGREIRDFIRTVPEINRYTFVVQRAMVGDKATIAALHAPDYLTGIDNATRDAAAAELARSVAPQAVAALDAAKSALQYLEWMAADYRRHAAAIAAPYRKRRLQREEARKATTARAGRALAALGKVTP